MKINLIAVHYDTPIKNMIGFRMLDADAGKTMDVPYNNVVQVLQSKKADIYGLEVYEGKLRGSNGSLDRYAKVVNGKLHGTSPIVILKELGDQGYTVSDWAGQVKNFRTEDVVKLAKTIGIANGKVVTRADGTTYISAIIGTYEKTELPQSQKTQSSINTNNNNQNNVNRQPVTQPTVQPPVKQVTMVQQPKVQAQQPVSAPVQTVAQVASQPVVGVPQEAKDRAEKIKKLMEGAKSAIQTPRVSGRELINSQLKDFDPVSQMTIEQKMAKAMLVIRNVRSFYYAILSTIKKVETKEVPTMGVSLDTLYYNPDFVKELTLPEVVFILIHEVLHLAMQHGMRKSTRIHKMWNVACDLFINKLISEEFGIQVAKKTKKIPDSNEQAEVNYSPVKEIENDHLGVGIAFGEGGLYNPDINIETDTPEKIYDEIMSEVKKQMEKQQGQGQGQGQGQDQEQGDSGDDSGEGDSEADDGEGQGNSSVGNKPKKGKGKGTGNGGDTKDEDGEGQGGPGKDKSDKTGEPKDGSGDGEGDIYDKEQKLIDNSKFRGKQIGKLRIVDVIEDDKTADMSETQKDAAARTILERAIVLQKQLGSFSGEAGGWLERYVEQVLAPKVNWTSLLKNKLTLASQTVNTFSRPDRRFISRGMTMPGPKKLENDALENVKVAIDTSGSISDKDLGVALAQIKQLLDNFKAKAEVMYWDTQVRKTEPFKDIKELLKIKPAGGGGTDVNCVFEEFEKGDYKKGKKAKPSIIIIFTDGYFGTVERKYSKYKDTIWVIHDNDNFKPPFGTMAKFKYD